MRENTIPAHSNKAHELSGLADFQRFGRLLYDAGLVSYRAGNMSVRTGEGLVITRTGASLAFLRQALLVGGPLDREIPGASIELNLHQSIYAKTRAAAIIHSHPPHAVILSILLDIIVPADSEGRSLVGDVPVIIETAAGRPGDSAVTVARLLEERDAVMVRGHGSFITGGSLEEAFSKTSTLEASCKVLYGLMQTGQRTRGNP